MLFALFALCVVLTRSGLLDRDVLIFVTRLIVGVARDAGWIRQSRRVWSLYERVIDWAKVRDISDNAVANQSMRTRPLAGK